MNANEIAIACTSPEQCQLKCKQSKQRMPSSTSEGRSVFAVLSRGQGNLNGQVAVCDKLPLLAAIERRSAATLTGWACVPICCFPCETLRTKPREASECEKQVNK
eukprot:4311503-Amphidinium_carterae.1